MANHHRAVRSPAGTGCALFVAAVICAATAVRGAAPAGTDADAASRSQPAVFRAALNAVLPSLVKIETIGGALPLEQLATPDGEPVSVAGFRQADGPTTGLICSADGYILTSSFNFVRDPAVITVRFADGRRFVARLVARDRPARLALLKIDAAGLPVTDWLPPAELHIGQWALVAGYGHGGDAPALSVGILSALSRLEGRAVQTDARTSPANYGGPLFDVQGRVIGICVPKAGKGADEIAGVDWYDSGIGFAIRADYLAAVLPRLKSGTDFQAGFLGLLLEPADPVIGGKPDELTRDGVRIMQVAPGSAANAGIEAEDVITQIDGAPARRSLDIARILARKSASETVEIAYRRGDTAGAVCVKLMTADELQAAARAAMPESQESVPETP